MWNGIVLTFTDSALHATAERNKFGSIIEKSGPASPLFFCRYKSGIREIMERLNLTDPLAGRQLR